MIYLYIDVSKHFQTGSSTVDHSLTLGAAVLPSHGPAHWPWLVTPSRSKRRRMPGETSAEKITGNYHDLHGKITLVSG